MPDTPSITIVKAIVYRGKREETSNKYHFSGTTPSSDAAWKTLADAIIAEEAKLVTTRTKFVRAYGYAAGNELSVAQIDYESAPNTVVSGAVTPNGSNEILMQPESALTIRWKTPERNSRKKWIYLRKYFHGCVVALSDGETIQPSTITAAKAFAAKMTDGTLPGGAKYCGPQGAVAESFQVAPFATSRELKRRGKRPSR